MKIESNIPFEPANERETVPGAAETTGQATGVDMAAANQEAARMEIPVPPKETEAESAESKLAAARDRFIKEEQELEKNWSIRSSYELARTDYERARAEIVGTDINKFLEEETNLADSRIKAAAEKQPGAWEKISGAWKWLGDQNLEKLGWKPEGRFKRIIARGANLRVAIGASLLGIGFFAPPVFFLTVGARRLMSGTGAAVMTSEWLKARAEVSRTSLADQEIKEIPEDEIEGKIGDMVVGLRMQGRLASESEEYQKLMGRYEEILREKYQIAENISLALDDASGDALAGFETAQKREATGRTFRNLTSLSVGVGAAIGLGPLINYFSGSAQAAEAVSQAGTPGLRPADVINGGNVGTGAASPELVAGNTGVADVVDVKELQAKFEETTQRQVSQIVENMITEEAQKQAGEAAATETAAAAIPDSFEITVQRGEGPIHEARKAISEYLAMSGNESLKELSKAQRILAEEKLYRAMRAAGSIPEKWEVGTKVSFGKEMIEKTLNEVGSQTPEQAAALDKNLAQYVDGVNWTRYNVTVSPESGNSIHCAWEMDEGIKRASKAAIAAAGETAGANLDQIIFSEDTNFIAVDPGDEGGSGATLDEIILQAQNSGAVGEAVKEIDPVLAQELLEAKEAAINSAVERIGIAVSRLSPEEYAVIKDLKISDALNEVKNSLITGTSRTVTVMRKLGLYDRFITFMGALPAEEGKRASGLTVNQFIRTYYFKGEFT